MGQPLSKIETVLQLVRKRGTLRPRDLAEFDLPLDSLDRLRRRGLIERVGWGLYASPTATVSEHHSLVTAQQLVPKGVVCLLSALRFHDLTTQAPHQVWLALPNKAWTPRVNRPKLRLVRYSGSALTAMVQERRLEGVTVRVYSPAKTVADCFKYRNKVGLDVALEALRDCWAKKKASMDDLWAAAAACRMTNVMRPYLESLV